MLDPEERNPINFYPRSGKPLDYNPGGLRERGYLIYNSNGDTFLNFQKLQQDLDKIADNDPSCKCSGECNCDHGNVTGADPYTEAAVQAIKGIGNIAQAFKKGDAAGEISQRIRAAKQQCPKKPLIAITKAAKQRRAAYESCMSQIASAEKEFQNQMLQSGRTSELAKLEQAKTSGENTKTIVIVAAISAVFIILAIVLIIWIRRNKNQKQKDK